MKKFFAIVLCLAFSVALHAQKDVTKFLGIPIDGSKTEMIQKLKKKGFSSVPGYSELLQGEFNGHDVYVSVGTNNNKVYRIMVSDQNELDEGNIRIRFNTLCKQFENNSKYISFTNYRIPEDEDISYEISAHSKIYEAYFYQSIEKMDTLTLQHELLEELHSLYTPEQLENPTDEMKEKITEISIRKGLDILEKKTVWFRIMENYGKYRINIYYDNKYNEANGEDL